MKDKNENPLISYAKYSSIVFQMLFIIGFSFWGGAKLNQYFELKNNLVTVIVGLFGLCISLYVTIKSLENLNKKNEE